MRPPLDPKSKSVLVALRLPASLLRVVDAEAKRSGSTRSAVLRAALARGLARVRREP